MASNSFSISAKSCRNFSRFGAGACRHRPSVSRRSQHPHHRQQSKHPAWHPGHNGPTCPPGMLIPDLIRGQEGRPPMSREIYRQNYVFGTHFFTTRFTSVSLGGHSAGLISDSRRVSEFGAHSHSKTEQGRGARDSNDAGGCCLPADLTAHHESVALKRPPGTKRAFYILLAPSRLQEACARRSMPARRH